MNFFLKNLKEKIRALNKTIERRGRTISVKKVKDKNQIKPNNRSKINFYWRSLKLLVEKKILAENGTKKPKLYEILTTHKITIDDVYP
ncbi:hypothetical protein ES703_21165 [subsurface metagenome]